MNIILTGGTGLIGRALTTELIMHGHDVTILSRSPDLHENFPPQVHLVHWDARTPAGWGHLVEQTDAIVNLAGKSLAGENLLEMRWTPERKKHIINSRLNAGKAVLEAVQAAKKKPSVVVQASAVGYYGPRGPEPVSEITEPGKDFSAKLCIDWEASTQSVEDFGPRWVGIRTGIVLSGQGGALPRQLLPFKFFAGGPLGSGKQGYPWIHIADEVAAICFLLENPDAKGSFNLTGPTMVSNGEFGRILAKTMRRPYWIPVPSFVFKLAFGEASTILLDGQFVEPKKLKALGYQFRFDNPEAAIRDILDKKTRASTHG